VQKPWSFSQLEEKKEPRKKTNFHISFLYDAKGGTQYFGVRGVSQKSVG
jgi:hypothetical protein